MLFRRIFMGCMMWFNTHASMKHLRWLVMYTGLYTGEWSTPPTCEAVKKVKNSVMKPLYIVLPFFLLPLFMVLLCVFVEIKYKQKTLPDLKGERIQLDTTLALLTDNDESLLPSKRKQQSTLSLDSFPSLERKRKFDAFFLYHFDMNHDFVVNHLIPELKDARHFKLHIHGIDFQPGHRIKENIERAMTISNNAIILLSSGFTISRWCTDEFV